jgi:thioredoxin-related protein
MRTICAKVQIYDNTVFDFTYYCRAKILTMKRFMIITIGILFFLQGAFSQEHGIRFVEKPFAELQAMAKKENKLIFLDAYTSWCGPCKWMAANMFTQDTIGTYFNQAFICTHFDMEKGEGTTLAKRFQVRAYPTLLFIDSAGNVVHKRVGAAQKVEDYLAMGRIALDPEQSYTVMQRKYAAGANSPDFIFNYLTRLADAYEPYAEVLDKYLATQSPEQLLNRGNWNLLYRFSNDVESKQFRYMVDHRKEYAKLYTRDSVYGKISDTYYSALMMQSRYAGPTNAGYDLIVKHLRESGFEDADKVIAKGDMNLYLMRGQPDKYFKKAFGAADTFFHDDYQMLNEIAWNAHSFAPDTSTLQKACSLAKRSVELKSVPFNNDTYAALLFQLGKKKEAIRTEKTAIKLAKERNEPTKSYEDSLKKMEAPEPKKKP